MDITEDGKTPIYSADTTNNGIIGYCNKEPNYIVNDTIPLYLIFGDHTRTMNIVENSFCIADNVKVLIPKYNSIKILLYISTVWKKAIPNLGYARHWTKAKNVLIILPTKTNGLIDLEFIEKYISELEEERISELTAYLKVSGLDNYELSNDEINAIAEFKNSKFREFSIAKDIFEVNNTHNILSSWIVPNSGKIPYVTASEKNNSISTYIDYDKDMIEKGNSIMIGGKTLVISYQPNDYFSNDSHNLSLYLKEKERANTEIMLYLVSSLYKSLKPIYTWGDSISKKKIQKDTITLPVKENGSINYDLMNLFIKAQEKLAIKDVVIWKDRIIDKTKNIIIN